MDELHNYIITYQYICASVCNSLKDCRLL